MLQHLTRVIEVDLLYDRANPCIVICDAELERALSVRAATLSDLKDLVSRQLFLRTAAFGAAAARRSLWNPAQRDFGLSVCSNISSSAMGQIFRRSRRLGKVVGQSDLLLPDADFASFLLATSRSFPLPAPRQGRGRHFTFDECAYLTLKYICASDKRFLDARHLNVCLCLRDRVLRDLFGVSAFHKGQLM